MSDFAPLDPERIVRVLARRGVEYVHVLVMREMQRRQQPEDD